MPRYIRARLPGGSYFFTVALADRKSDLLLRHIDALRTALVSVRQERPFDLDAIVVLPEHLHCIWTLPMDDAGFRVRWQMIKSRFSRAIPEQGSVQGRKGERGIWQRRYWEHLIRDETEFERHVDYIHFNPVKHGFVDRAADWPHSSFLRFVARGTYLPSWAAAEPTRQLEFE